MVSFNLIVQSMKDETIICFKHKSLGESTGLNAYASNVTYEEIKNLKLRNSKESILRVIRDRPYTI